MELLQVSQHYCAWVWEHGRIFALENQTTLIPVAMVLGTAIFYFVFMWIMDKVLFRVSPNYRQRTFARKARQEIEEEALADRDRKVTKRVSQMERNWRRSH